MSTTVPLSITQEATDYIAEKGLQQPFQRMLDNIPQHFRGLHGIAVSVMDPYDLGGEPRVIIDVTRDYRGLKDDPTEREWDRWVVETFPPEVFQYFVVTSICVPHHLRQSVLEQKEVLSTTVPLSITQEATDYIAEKGLQQPFQQILDNIPQGFPKVRSLEVSVVDPYDMGGEPRVVIDVFRDDLGLKDDPTDREFGCWILNTFPPEVFQYFVVMSITSQNHAR
jgi:hypothetical protein